MNDEIRQKYFHTFSTPIGREVLIDILTDCHFGCTLNPENTAQISEYNVGVAILAKCGVFGPERAIPVVDALMNSIVMSNPLPNKENE